MTATADDVVLTSDEFYSVTYKLVESLLIRHFGISPEQCFPHVLLDDDLCLDSLELLDFALLLEEECGVALHDGALDHARTLGDLVDTVVSARLNIV